MYTGASALDQSLRQMQSGAQEPLAARHLPRVGLMVVAGQVQQAVQNENLDFGGERMVLLARLAQGRGHADGQVAGHLFCAGTFGGKGEHVGGLVLAPELTIEPADGRVGGQQHGHLALQAHGSLRGGQESGQGARGGKMEIFGV